MRILFVDDLPDVMRVYAARLENEGHQVLMLPDMTGALRTAQRQARANTPFDLLVIDLMLNRFEPEFDGEQKKLAQALAQKQQPNIPSGQALGLRLWNTLPRQAYCYLSAHPQLRVAGVDQEFNGASDAELAVLLMQKDRLRSTELSDKLCDVVGLWRNKGW